MNKKQIKSEKYKLIESDCLDHIDESINNTK